MPDWTLVAVDVSLRISIGASGVVLVDDLRLGNVYKGLELLANDDG